MSFRETRISEHLRSKTSKESPRTEVPFAQTRIGDFEIVIAAKSELADESFVSEEAIERQLVREGLVRVPPSRRQIQEEFERIDVAGQPISEMIIEERR
jgi:hypothetical protein